MQPCPYCGKALVVVKENYPWSVTLPQRQMTQLENVAATPFSLPTAPAGGGKWQKVTPVGRLEPKDITTALYDSGVSFVLITLAGSALVYAAGWPWLVAPAGGLVVAMWRYFGGLGLAESLLEMVETITQTDLNRDGAVGQTKHVVRVEVKDKDRWQFATLPGQPAALVSLAQKVSAGQSFTERTAADAGLTQDEFSDLRDVFVDRQWAVWNHDTRRQQGVTLTLSGKAVLRSIAAAPLPTEDGAEI